MKAPAAILPLLLAPTLLLAQGKEILVVTPYAAAADLNKSATELRKYIPGLSVANVTWTNAAGDKFWVACFDADTNPKKPITDKMLSDLTATLVNKDARTVATDDPHATLAKMGLKPLEGREELESKPKLEPTVPTVREP